MTSSDVITPGDEHRDELVGLMRVAFNLGSGTPAERAAWMPVEVVLEAIKSTVQPSHLLTVVAH
jgi:hypothetical protein